MALTFGFPCPKCDVKVPTKLTLRADISASPHEIVIGVSSIDLGPMKAHFAEAHA